MLFRNPINLSGLKQQVSGIVGITEEYKNNKIKYRSKGPRERPQSGLVRDMQSELKNNEIK
jgi:hypothetical protein